MLEISEEITAFLLAQSEFTTVMGDRVFPLVANEGTAYPFTTYALSEEPISNDGDEFTITLFLYFDKANYLKCAAFITQLKNIIKENYDWLSSNIELLEESLGFVGIINFKKQ